MRALARSDCYTKAPAAGSALPHLHAVCNSLHIPPARAATACTQRACCPLGLRFSSLASYEHTLRGAAACCKLPSIDRRLWMYNHNTTAPKKQQRLPAASGAAKSEKHRVFSPLTSSPRRPPSPRCSRWRCPGRRLSASPAPRQSSLSPSAASTPVVIVVVCRAGNSDVGRGRVALH